MSDELFMKEALRLAEKAQSLGEVPVGAVVVLDGEIIARGYNRREIDQDPLAHAEILAIREAASQLSAWRLSGCTLYVTLEPCAMCAGALVNARVDRLVYGAQDPKAGAVQSLMHLCTDARLNHRLEVASGVLEEESAGLLKAFFKQLRAPKD